MSITDWLRFGTILAAGVLLVRCGGVQQGAVPAPGISHASVVRHSPHGVSWMGKGLKQQTLLYVSNQDGIVNVYRYWQHTLVGVLTDFTGPLGECVDAAGDVYIVDYQNKSIDEYAHGGKKPIDVIDDSPFQPYGCAVDQKTGNLAVANYGESGKRHDYYYYDNGNIAIYPHGSGKPAYYGSAVSFTSLGYDDRGDLLATARDYWYYSYFWDTEFYYLPKNGEKLLSIDLPNSQSSSSGWPTVQSIAYDGTYWAILSYDRLFRYTINIKGQEVDELELSGGSGDVQQISFYRKTPKAAATQVVAGGTDYENGDTFVGYWDYPSLGDPYFQITKDLDAPFGVAISPGS